MNPDSRRPRRARAGLAALGATLLVALAGLAPSGAAASGLAAGWGPQGTFPDPGAQASPRIIGGKTLNGNASAEYTVAIQTSFGADEVGGCSGTVVDALHVLTAAHCVVEKTAPATPAQVNVAAGAGDVRTPESRVNGAVVGVAAIRVHPRYVPSGFNDDAAVLTLAQPLDLASGRIKALPLAPVGALVGAGTSIRVTGFGITSATGQDFGVLRSVSTSAVTAGQCGTNAPAAMLCTYRPSHGACSGDSGGTATAGSPRVLVGVTNLAASNCKRGINLFANVSAPEIRVFVDAALREQDVTKAQTPLSPRGGLKVRVAGSARVGTTVTCRRGSWSSGTQFRYVFFRLRGSSERDTKASAKRTYRVRASDRGRRIGCAVLAGNAGGVGASLSRNALTVRG
jgi:hypothetical protein